jgi:hypothetical protein
MAAERAAGYGRPAPAITTNAMVALDGDPHLPGRDALMRSVTDPDGMFGIPAEQAAGAVVTGGPAAVAGHLAEIAAHGARRTVVTLVAGDWFRQAELLAEAGSQLPA